MPNVTKAIAALVLAAGLGAQEPARPVYGAWGLNLAGMDATVKPGDDFFRFANGRWLDANPIPGDKTGSTLRLQMTERTEGRLHELLERAATAAPATLAGKAGAFYAAFMDENRVERLGAKPLAPDLKRVRLAKDRSSLAALMGHGVLGFESALFQIVLDVDLKQPDRYAAYLSQGGLGLPDRDYYLKEGFAPARTAYRAYVARLLTLVGWPEAETRAAEVVAFETELAKVSWSKVEQRDPIAMYHLMTPAELRKLTPGFGWRGYLAASGLAKVPRVIVCEASAFPRLASVYAATPVPVLQAWQAFHLADNAAPYLSRPFADAHFELHDRTLSGQKEPRARWKRAVTAVAGDDFTVSGRFGGFGTLGFGVGQLYTARYFGPEAKAKIEALVLDLKSAFHARLEKLDWMGPETRQEALRKLDTYTIKVGYPDHPRDYSALALRADDLVGDVRRAAAADWAFYAGRLPGPVDRTSWDMTPQTNDAYNGYLRDIVFPAGILQAPMFDPQADPAINYGAIGGVIGHELTHGFDDQGRKFDSTGALRDWWTPADAAQFEARASQLSAQYSAFEPLPGVHVNGSLTLGENIADLGGLTMALEAYHTFLHGRPAPVLEGLTGDQRVFLGWAQAWCGKVTDDYLKNQVTTDPHSPRRFRVLGPTRNLDAWYEVFGVQPGDKMYLAPAQRVRIW